MSQARQLTTVYFRTNLYILIASSQTTAGFWVGNEECLTLGADVSTEDLGAGVLRMLDTSRTGIPTPDPRQKVLPPSVRAAGLKSVSAFMKGTKYVGLERKGSAIEVMPYHNGGAEGFLGIPQLAIELRDVTPIKLGEQVLTALQQAT